MQNTPEVLAAEIGAEMGEPCDICGCTLYYQSGPYSCATSATRVHRSTGD